MGLMNEKVVVVTGGGNGLAGLIVRALPKKAAQLW